LRSFSLASTPAGPPFASTSANWVRKLDTRLTFSITTSITRHSEALRSR